MTEIIDRRMNPKGKSLVSRQRFLKKNARMVRKAIQRKVAGSNIGDLAGKSPKRIGVGAGRGTHEPTFHHGKGGEQETVHPGNKKFSPGDSIPRPEDSAAAGSGGSPRGEGEDEFSFEVSREEFLQYVFEGLELPDMVKKVLSGDTETVRKRAGFTSDGSPSKMDVRKTMANARVRKVALTRLKKAKKRKLEEERDELKQTISDANGADTSIERDRLAEVDHEIEVLERRIKAIRFIDKTDLRYRRHERVSVPTTQAVMFCMMDVSGSMSEWHKDIGKRFFLLLYLFLDMNYERVQIVFIRHTQEAKEVDEEEFFHSRETGGTVVSSALELMLEIIQERYPPEKWNIYACHASDGDNWPNDSENVFNLLFEHVMPLLQYYAYIEVRDRRKDSELWSWMELVCDTIPHFAMSLITNKSDIYAVFRELFESNKEVAHG